MDKIKLLAEEILISAAKSNGGDCYPSQINARSGELYNALELLEMYGSTFPMSSGAMPIFTINELGKHFASTGAWTGEEARAKIATARHNEQMALQRKNNKLVILSIVATVVIGLATLLVAIFK